MAKIIFTHRVAGKVTKVTEKEVSKIVAETWVANVKKWRDKRIERMESIMQAIPQVHIDILRYRNHHTKKETIAAFPNHVDFINKTI